ncbi:MAG: hypothetical protein R3C53_19095 [Pirellulaceae bacterium]
MNIRISNEIVAKLVSRLDAAGITNGKEAERIERILELMAESSSITSLDDLIARMRSEPQASENALELAQRLGVVGCMDGPADLATNPCHLDGFGE